MGTIKTEVTVIGAGSAGISAIRRLQKAGKDFVLIDCGPLGTTCARVGCMPSKALIHAAKEYHSRKQFRAMGIMGAEKLECSIPEVLEYVREMRDKFTLGMVKATKKLAGDRLITGEAYMLAPDRVRVGEDVVQTDKIVIATGGTPIVPKPWRGFGERVFTSENIFEQRDLPARIGVIGLGAIGLELGQALSRLGIDISSFSMLDTVGGITDPDINHAAVRAVSADLDMHIGSAAEIEESGDDLKVSSEQGSAKVDSVLIAAGVSPNVQGLGLENLGIDLDDRGLPTFDAHTAQIGDLPVYIAGDANGCRPILHEALDEGFIAGGNAAGADGECFCRRIQLRMVFSEPQIAVAGLSRRDLQDREVLVGEAKFEDQSRAVLEGANAGLLHVYAEPATGELLGAEMAIPGAEHIAHVLAVAIQQRVNVFELLRMPFYHPTLEEGLRTALRDIAARMPDKQRVAELSLCGSCPESALC